MNAFFAGVIFGALFAGSAVVVFVTRMKNRKREIIDWTERAYEPPVVTKITVNRHRSIDI